MQAGPHRVTAAFLQRFEGPVNDLVAPIEHTLADTEIGIAVGITTLPHLRNLAVVGPHRVTGVSDTASRRTHLHLPADDGGRRDRVRHGDRPRPGRRRVPPAADRPRGRRA